MTRSSSARCTLAGLGLALFAVAGAGTEPPTAVAIADEVLEALGGQAAWDATGVIRFTFAGRRTHFWDKANGRLRLEGETRDGDRYVVLLDLQTRQGRVALNGAEVAGEELAEWLERAWGAWINDTYWLVMPYKLRDSGVRLTYEGREELDGVAHDKLGLSFDGVGLTPGDRYWVYVHPETRLVSGWSYILQDQPADGPATHWRWSGWQRFGDILLAPGRRDPDSGRELPLSDIAVFESLPDAVFTAFDPDVE